MRVLRFDKWRGFNESLKLNGFVVENISDSKYTFFSNDGEILESIDFEFDKKGGIIVFSTDINVVQLSENRLLNKLKQIVYSIMNKRFVNKKISNVLTNHDDVFGFTVGKFVKGRYKSENGNIYDENSISVEIIGIDSNTLLKVAEDISFEFRQESVLVKDYEKNSIYIAKND